MTVSRKNKFDKNLEASRSPPLKKITSRGHVFTINNPIPTDWEQVRSLINIESTKFGRYQLEFGSTGTPHIQGYVEHRNSRRTAGIKSTLPRAHVEPRRGSTRDAWEYVCKPANLPDGTEPRFYSRGAPPTGGGQRTDLLELAMHAQNVGDPRSALNEYPTTYFRYFRNYGHVRDLVSTGRKPGDPLVVVLYYGDPGTGKTRKAFEENPGAYMVPVQQGGSIWFDGYQKEKVIIMDEFEGEMPLNQLLRLLDRYPLRVPIKGGFTMLDHEKLIITSNQKYDLGYKWEDREIKKTALYRRLTDVYRFETTELGVSSTTKEK